MTSAASTTNKKNQFPLRKRTGTAAFHLSTDAVGFGLQDIEKLSKRECVELFASARWGSFKTMPCPHCSCIANHYWTVAQLRWKCKGCGKRFSVTSQTVLADHKLPLSTILKMALSWSNGASGKAALQLRRDWNIAYATAFTLLQKLREGLLRGFNGGVLVGAMEMDGADLNGRNYKAKRNRPQGGGKPKAKPQIPDFLLKPDIYDEALDVVGPPLPPKFGKAAKQPEGRRILLALRQMGRSSGKGAVRTRIAVALTESKTTVLAVAKRFASSEATFMTDEDPGYATFGTEFSGHKTVRHSETYSTPDGTNNNQAESFNWRIRRAIEGVYLSASNKYLKDYAAEAAWREDTRRLSTFSRLKHLLTTVLGVGLSQWWRGYTHGVHRGVELLVEGEKVASGRGKQVGQRMKPPR